MVQPRRSPRTPVAIVALVAILLLAPIASMALAQGPDGPGSGDEANGTGDRTPSGEEDHEASENGTDGSSGGQEYNSTREENRTSEQDGASEPSASSQQGNSSQADGSSGSDSQPDDRTDRPPEDQGSDRQPDQPDERASGSQGRADQAPRADPVEIQNLPRGFTTSPPAGSQRPSVTVHADEGRARVARAGVAPLSVHLDTVVEHVDEDDDGVYDLGEPVIHRSVLRQTPHRIVPDEANQTASVIYSLDGGGELVLSFSFTTEVGPEVGTKLDIIIRNRTFEDPSTRIALGTRVETAEGLEPATIDGQPALAGSSGDSVAYMSWVPEVTVDGQDHEVGWSAHIATSSQGQDAIVYWSYPQGQEIIHDPVLGVTAAIEDLAGQALPFALAIGAGALVLATGYAVRRRGRL